MAQAFSIPESFKVVAATAGPVTTNGGVTGNYVSLKNAHKATLVLQFTQAVGHATAITVRQATAVAGTSAKNGSASTRIWANEDTATNDTLVAQTAAASYTVTNDIKKKMVVIEIDPSQMDVANGFDVAGFTIADSSQATNFVCGTWYIHQRYAQATPPSAVVN